MYKLSVITVVKNNYREIDLTIKSVISQSIKKKQYIIVDGFSTDGTWEIIEKYAKKYSFIKAFKRKDNNLYDLLNFGLTKATGEYLHLLHSGDFFFSKNSLQKTYDFAKSKLLEGTFSPVIYFNKKFKISREWKIKKKIFHSPISLTPLYFYQKMFIKDFFILLNIKFHQTLIFFIALKKI